MIDVDITRTFKDKAIITMTKQQALLLRKLVGSIFGEYEHKLVIDDSEELNAQSTLIYELVVNPLYEELKKVFDA